MTPGQWLSYGWSFFRPFSVFVVCGGGAISLATSALWACGPPSHIFYHISAGGRTIKCPGLFPLSASEFDLSHVVIDENEISIKPSLAQPNVIYAHGVTRGARAHIKAGAAEACILFAVAFASAHLIWKRGNKKLVFTASKDSTFPFVIMCLVVGDSYVWRLRDFVASKRDAEQLTHVHFFGEGGARLSGYKSCRVSGVENID